MNLKELVEYGNSEDVAMALGIERKKAGARTAIRCPSHKKNVGHEDRSIGNCILTPKGYLCFSCGASGHFVKMAADYLGLDYDKDDFETVKTAAKETARIAYPEIADTVYSNQKDSRTQTRRIKRILTDEEMSLIGLVPYVNVKTLDKEAYAKGKERESIQGYATKNLMYEEPEAFCIMALGKAYEKVSKLTSIYLGFKSKSDELAKPVRDMIIETKSVCLKLERYINKNWPQYNLRETLIA